MLKKLLILHILFYIFTAALCLAIHPGMASADLTFGSTTITTDGNLTVAGAPISAYVFGSGTTTGTVTVGGLAQSGNIVIGQSSAANSILVGSGSGASTITLATGNGSSVVGIGNTSPSALLHLGTPGTRAGIMKMAGATSGTVTVTPASVAGTWTLTLPADDGTSGQFLSTDGNGITSWATAGGGGSGDVAGPASSTDNAITRFDGTTGKLIQNSSATIDDSGIITAPSVVTSGLINTTRPYKVYTALLNQDGTTAAPTATVLENTLGDTVTWARESTGNYTATLSSAVFPANKTFILTNITSTTYRLASERVDSSTVGLSQASNLTDQAVDGLDVVSIEIRVYP